MSCNCCGRAAKRGLTIFLAMHGRALQLAVGLAVFDVIALVVLQLAFAHADQNFHDAVFPIHRQRHERAAFHGRQFEKFADFALVEKQLARCFRDVTKNVGLRVFTDVRVVEPDFVLLHARERVADLGFAGAKRLDLRAPEHEAGFERFRNEKIAAGLGIVEDFRHGATLR